MRKFVLLFLFCVSTLNIYSQELNAIELVDNILEVQSMRELTKFREGLIKELKSLDMSNITPEEHTELGSVYEKMRVEYNSLIGQIKQDVLDFKNIKKMTKSSGEISSKYKTTINNVSDIYNNEFLPTYASLSQDRSLLALIFPYIEKGIRFIIDIIREKKLKKETLMNDLLNIANLKFNDCLVLPSWNSLVKTNQSNYIVSTKTIQDITTSEVKLKSSKLISVDTTISIEYPAMKELNGKIEFISYDDLGNKSNMEFLLPDVISKNRDLTVGNKNVISKTSFGSKQSYGEGTSFQVRITNTGFVYVFAFNSDNTCYPIYPYNQDWIQTFNMSKDRDLGVGPLMMKDDNNLLVIPSKNIDNNEENYIQINGTNTKEQLCLILSKSEIDLNTICQSINNSTGTLNERLKTVLNNPNIGNLENITLSSQSGIINFDVKESDKWIIPLVFEIKRR